MKRVSPFLGLLVMVLLASSAPLTSIHAQGDPPIDEQATIDRFVQALASMTTYDTYELHAVEMGRQEQVVTLVTGTVLSSEIAASEVETQEINASRDPHNVQMWQTVTIFNESIGDETSISDYVLSAEIRRVDGELYVNAERTLNPDADPIANAELAPVPQGWVIINDHDEWPGLGPLALSSGQAELEPGIYDYVDVLIPLAETVTVEATTLADGTPVTTITITGNADMVGAALQAESANDPNSDTAFDSYLFNMMSDESYLVLRATLDDSDLVRQLGWHTFATFPDIDLHDFEPSLPVGSAFLNMELEYTIDISLDRINVPIDPIIAPELG